MNRVGCAGAWGRVHSVGMGEALRCHAAVWQHAVLCPDRCHDYTCVQAAVADSLAEVALSKPPTVCLRYTRRHKDGSPVDVCEWRVACVPVPLPHYTILRLLYDCY
jgi:hypothetical protein